MNVFVRKCIKKNEIDGKWLFMSFLCLVQEDGKEVEFAASGPQFLSRSMAADNMNVLETLSHIYANTCELTIVPNTEKSA